MIKIIEKGLMNQETNRSVRMCTWEVFSGVAHNEKKMESLRMCRNSGYKDPIRMCPSGYGYDLLDEEKMESLRMCRNSGYKDPIRMCPSGYGYDLLDEEKMESLRMCRNSGYKDPVLIEELFAKAI